MARLAMLPSISRTGRHHTHIHLPLPCQPDTSDSGRHRRQLNLLYQ
jgi:hypothetical protein